MLDFNAPEFLIVGIVALLVIGPKDLPKAMRFVGTWVGKARRVANQFRSGLDNMVRESELADLEKKWAEENARIMREHPPERYITGPDAIAPDGLKQGDDAVAAPVPAASDTAQRAVDNGGEQPIVTTPAPEIREDARLPVDTANAARPSTPDGKPLT